MKRLVLAGALLCAFAGSALAAPEIVSAPGLSVPVGSYLIAGDVVAIPPAWSPGPLYIAAEPYLLSVFGILFSALLTWALAILQKRTGIAISDSAKADLQQSALNAAGRIMASQEAAFASAKINVGSKVIADELPTVLVTAGAAIKTLGLTPDRVSNLILAKVGQLQVGALGNTTAAPAPAPDPAKGSSP